MSDHEKVFVICENKCFEEGMTKEQILEEGKFVTDPVTEIKHKTRWLSKAQYEALDGNYEPNTEYHVYDEEYFVAHAERADIAVNASDGSNIAISLNNRIKVNSLVNSQTSFEEQSLNNKIYININSSDSDYIFVDGIFKCANEYYISFLLNPIDKKHLVLYCISVNGTPNTPYGFVDIICNKELTTIGIEAFRINIQSPSVSPVRTSNCSFRLINVKELKNL